MLDSTPVALDIIVPLPRVRTALIVGPYIVASQKDEKSRMWYTPLSIGDL